MPAVPTPPTWLPAGPVETDPTGAVLAALNAGADAATRPAGGAGPVLVLAGATEIRRALDGVPIGAYDRRIAEWLDGWDLSVVAIVLSWLYRTRAAGIAFGAAQAAAAERLRLAELLRQMHDRQDAQWEAQPDQDRPGYLFRSWYLDGLQEAATLVERGGADGIPVRVDAAADAPAGQGRTWGWMTGSRCADCGERGAVSRGWHDEDGPDYDDDWCREQGHQLTVWSGPDPDADQDAAAAVERWWERFAHAEESARLLAAGTDDAAARWHAGRAAELTAALGDELGVQRARHLPPGRGDMTGIGHGLELRCTGCNVPAAGVMAVGRWIWLLSPGRVLPCCSGSCAGNVLAELLAAGLIAGQPSPAGSR